jgi:orotate phosphoribosyltransferase
MKLREMLIKEGVIKIRKEDEESFVINEFGTKSRLFIDIKEASLNPDILNEIKMEIYEKCAHDRLFFNNYDRIASVAIGGVPIATMLSINCDIPQVIIRPSKHERGTQSQIIGNCKNKKVILIEDVAVTGNTIIKGVKVIREAGGICSMCIVVVDRQEGAEKNCLDNDVILLSLLKKSDFGIDLE